MGFALDDGFAIYVRHAGTESKSANMPHASKLGGTTIIRIRINKQMGEIEVVSLQKRGFTIEERRAASQIREGDGTAR